MRVLEQAPLVVIDGNLPTATVEHVLQVCHHIQKPGKCRSYTNTPPNDIDKSILTRVILQHECLQT